MEQSIPCPSSATEEYPVSLSRDSYGYFRVVT
jgi:hypothetical protein